MQALLRKRIGNSKGVTLVELLAVLVILGIIALIAVPAIAGVIEDSKESSIKSTAINTINAAELYMTTNDLEGENLDYGLIEDDYVRERDGFSWQSGDPTIGVTTDGEITISGTGEIGEDDVSVTFTDATINDINSSEGNSVNGGE